MLTIRVFFPLVVLLLFSSILRSDELSDTYLIDQDHKSLTVGKGVYVFEDFSKSHTIEDAQKLYREGEFKQFEEETLNMGYRKGALWFKFSVARSENTLSEDIKKQHLFLTVQYPLLDDVQLFQVLNGNIKKMQLGDTKPFHERFYSIPDLVFPIEIPKNSKVDFFLRVDSTSSVSVPIALETEQRFVERSHRQEIFNGAYFGITLGLLVYNLFLWLGVRKRVYGLYVFAIFNLFLFNSTLSGHSYHFWPNASSFQQLAIYLFGISSWIAVALFGTVFLKTKSLQPNVHKLLLTLIAIGCICLPTLFFIPGEIAAKLNAMMLVVGVVVLLTASLRSYIMGYRPSIYFLIGQGGVMFSVIFTVLTSQGVIPLFHITDDVMKWSSAFELLLFSIGLADLVNHERRLRANAVQKAADIQKELLAAQVKENEKLDLLVRERTRDLEKANKRLEDLNTIDELTGLRNRRYLNQILPLEHQRAFRERQPLSVLMFDIDFFKKLNDTYGHQFGDLCLSTAGNIINSSIKRPQDVAIRYGGEEFVVVLPATNLEGALFIAERIRSKFEDTEVSDDQHSVRMTVSIGIAGGIPEDRENSEGMLKEADDYLYEAKENGRNQVVCALKQVAKSTAQ